MLMALPLVPKKVNLQSKTQSATIGSRTFCLRPRFLIAVKYN